VVGKAVGSLRVVINGAGSAGTAIARTLHRLGVGELVVCDRSGILNSRTQVTPAQAELAQLVNPGEHSGNLADAMAGRDVFIGVSAPGVVTPAMVASMAPGAIVFPMANPEPEIMPDAAIAAGAAVVGTGRSDFPNQINNVLAFPGVFRGALDAGARQITPEMMLAAAFAIAGAVPAEELSASQVVPSVFAPGVADKVAQAVANAWRKG